VTFDRYAFDLSKFTGGPQSVSYTVRERYIWDLIWPRADDALYVAQPEQYRSELSDRLAAPLYPVAFVILAYAFLGPPQTNRQGRTLALLGMTGAIALVRLTGFVSVIVGVRVPAILGVQFVVLFGAIIIGLWLISRGQALEPAAVVSRIATAIDQRIARATAG
jgi:lipopolysaccharide export system permease protein